MQPRFFSLTPRAPVGFVPHTPQDADFLEHPLVFFAESIEPPLQIFEESQNYVCGLIVTQADRFSFSPLNPKVWHLVVTTEMLPHAKDMAAGFLSLIGPAQESELSTTRNILETAIAQSPSGIIIADAPDVTIRLCNAAALGIRGGNQKLLTGIEVSQHATNWQTFHPDGTAYDPEDLPLSRAVLKGELTRYEEIIIRDEEGIDHWVSVNAAPIRDTQSNITAGVVIFHDITDRKLANAALKESQARLLSIFRVAPIGIGVVENRVLKQVNARLCEMVGYAEEELLEHSSKMLYLNEEDFDYVGQEKYKQIEAHGSGTVETQWRCKDGHVIDVLLSSTPLDLSDLEKGVTFTALDITERRKSIDALRASEAKFRGLIETTNDWIWEVDVQGRYTYASPQVEQILGHTPDEIIGRTPFDFMPDDSVDDIKAVFTTLVRDRCSVNGLENVVIGKNDRHVVLETSGVPIFDASGELTGFRGVDRDITDRKHAEAEKKRVEAQYQQAQKVESIGRLAGGIAHDLNNLLSPILGYSELLLDETSISKEQRDSILSISRAGKRARDLVRQLLAFSRKQTLEYKALDLNQSVVNIEQFLRRTIREDIAIHIDGSPGLPYVMADAGQIEQVLMNLMINAQDAMPNGGRLSLETGTVDLDSSYTDAHPGCEPGAYVVLAVSDTGCGMDTETQSKVFEPFFSTKGEFGTGLGLATAYGIVKQHGGNIWVYSELGKGTTFKVYLPVSSEVPGAAPAETVTSENLQGSETVLVVEDNTHVRTLACSILERQGYRVISAEDGPEALVTMDAFSDPIDLLLTDVVLPGLNGKQVYEKIVAIRPKIRVLYMSGYTNDVIVHRGVLQDGVAFIQKPFTVQDLSEKVRAVLDS